MNFNGHIPSDCRDLIHALNQRYRAQWDRAERLQAELDDIKGSRAWMVFRWLRRLRRVLRPMTGSKNPTAAQASSEERIDLSVLPGELVPTAKVSILIPFRDHLGLLRNCLRSLRRGSYRRLEIILLDNDSSEPKMRRYLRHMHGRRGFRVVACPGSFHFARICNRGARKARGEHLLFLNNDVEVLTADWLEQMLRLAEHPRVGVVGATLLYPDGAIQHAGIEPLRHGIWQHVHRGQPWGLAQKTMQDAQVVSAVTGACLLMRRDRFLELGGFDERYPLTHNDVDLCLRARERGWLTVVTPRARLMHFESLSRGYAAQSSPVDDVE